MAWDANRVGDDGASSSRAFGRRRGPAARWLLGLALVGVVVSAGRSARAEDASPPAPAPCLAPTVSTRQQSATVVTDDLWTAARRLRTLREAGSIDPQKVLVVFDIDNTLLAMDGLLGSDQWFNLQDALLARANPPPAPPAGPKPPEPTFEGALPPDVEPKPPTPLDPAWQSVESFDQLLDAQAALYALRPMRRTQPDGDVVVRSLQGRYTVIALTSRGPANRDATVRMLRANGISFAQRKVEVGPSVPEKDFEWSAAEVEATISKEDIELGGGVKKIAGRRMRYVDGVLMTSGANKGLALRMFLARAKEPDRWSNVFFVDDTRKHHLTMRNAYACLPAVHVETFWYTREHPCVSAYYASPWAMLRTAAELAAMRVPGFARCDRLVGACR
jgi:hypothetical protein